MLMIRVARRPVRDQLLEHMQLLTVSTGLTSLLFSMCRGVKSSTTSGMPDLSHGKGWLGL